MADILIYGKLKSASGGKLLDYSSIEGSPQILQTSGNSTNAVMSQAATMYAIEESIKEFAPFHFSGKAVRADYDSNGNVTTLYRESELSLKFSNREGDNSTIPGTDGEQGVQGIFEAPEGYQFTVNGRSSPSVEFYHTGSTVKCVFQEESGIEIEDLTELDGVPFSNIDFSTEDQFNIYRKALTVAIVPKNGNVWQLENREYAWNGEEWVELGFNLNVNLDGVYTKTEADNIFATKIELNNQINSITPATIGAATQADVESAILAALGAAEAALAEV